MSRRLSREHALQILYQCDLRGEAAASAEPRMVPADDFTENLVQGVIARVGEIDRRIAGHSEHWRLDRMPVVDRNILRLAVFELLAQDTPAAVVIDEALELARRFSNEESVAFLNGVLDAVRKDLEKVTAGAG
ncbi:MAG: transcription antitermination factor NusB [Bryobacteraceae bacterium]